MRRHYAEPNGDYAAYAVWGEPAAIVVGECRRCLGELVRTFPGGADTCAACGLQWG